MQVGKILCGCVQLYSNLRKHNDYYRTLALCRVILRSKFSDFVYFDD